MPNEHKEVRSLKHLQEQVNAYNDSTKRPAPPKGSGGSSQAGQEDKPKQTQPEKGEG